MSTSNVEIARRIASSAIIIRATAAPITFTVSTTTAHHQTRQISINNYGSTGKFDTEKPYFSQMSHTDYRHLSLV